MTDFRKAARELISQMTLEEKVSQMLHNSAPIERLGIPSYNWWCEALHGIARSGTATVFPQAIGMAATFDVDLLHEVASAISDEGRAKYHAYQEEDDRDIYKGLTFWSPNINIFRDPRWGRGHETYGEDPYLTSRLAINFIKGLQGDDPNHLKTAACAKHYAVHSGPEDVRHEFNATCNNYDLWNTYLPHFEATIYEANVEGFMGAYNRTNGEPCCGSQFLLQDILRKKWDFDGYVVSDCWAIKDFHEKHKVTSNAVESVALAVNTGCHLNCGNLYGHCVAAVHEGLLSEEKIDDAVEHLYVTRMKLGILGNHGAPEIPEYVNIPYDVIDCKKHKDLNLKIAQDGIVMLKNNGTLPLNPASIKSIGVIGPNANSRAALVGNYEGTASEYITVLEGITEKADKYNLRVYYSEGCHLYKEKTSVLSMADNRKSEAISVAKRSDVIILCMGLDASIEGEEGDTGNEFSSGDKNSLNLPGRQQRILKKVKAAAGEKPIILVNLAGSALAVTWADENVGAILHGFYPGAQGGRAIADIIFGAVSPSGKLPVTFYKGDDDLPDFTDYNMENRTYKYYKGEPLYPFGFGLGYSKFELSDVIINETEVSATVKNTGGRAASEVIQVYASTPEVKEIRTLTGFKKITLSAGESEQVIVKLDKNAFSRRDENGDLYKVAAKWNISVGFTQPDERSVKLYGASPFSASINIS